MEWNRSETLALAASDCRHCRGMGLLAKRLDEAPCRCVLRAIFRACYARFRECISHDLAATRASLECGATKDPGGAWGRRNEEFVADFLLVAKRVLTEEEHRMFRFRFLLGADWKLCCRRLGMDRPQFFRQIYGMQEKLGMTFRELQPYALYPIRDYFTPGLREARATVVKMPVNRERLSVPVKRAA